MIMPLRICVASIMKSSRGWGAEASVKPRILPQPRKRCIGASGIIFVRCGDTFAAINPLF
jgi:hypothetical protein